MSESQKSAWPRVAVIVVNWNGAKFLERCLSSLERQSVSPWEIIVVDNASDDGSLDIVRRFESVSLLAQDQNLGFAAGNNLAIEAVSLDVEWIALLNPDAFPDPRWIEELLTVARRHPDYEIFGSKLLDANNPSLLDGKGDFYHISGLARREAHGLPDDGPEALSREIFSPCAAAAMYRRDILSEANGFDNDYFCYMEDVDLGFRLRLLGYRCLYAPKSVVRHTGSATTGRHSLFSVYHGQRNMVWTYIKNMPGLLYWFLLPLHLLLNLAGCIYFSLKGQCRVVFRSKVDALKGLSKMWRKRLKIQAQRRVSTAAIWRVLDKRIILYPPTKKYRYRSKGI